MNRIASDEPDEVGIIPKPIRFYFRGRQVEATVARSGFSAASFHRAYAMSGYWHLEGEFGRAWLADPCGMALQEGLHAARMDESKAAAAARADRRKAKAALAEEEAQARRTKASRW